MASGSDKLRLKIYLSVFIAVLIVGTFGTMLIEERSLIDSLCFSIVTIATVGYARAISHRLQLPVRVSSLF